MPKNMHRDQSSGKRSRKRIFNSQCLKKCKHAIFLLNESSRKNNAEFHFLCGPKCWLQRTVGDLEDSIEIPLPGWQSITLIYCLNYHQDEIALCALPKIESRSTCFWISSNNANISNKLFPFHLSGNWAVPDIFFVHSTAVTGFSPDVSLAKWTERL